jgi:hypothetical protein
MTQKKKRVRFHSSGWYFLGFSWMRSRFIREDVWVGPYIDSGRAADAARACRI